MPIKNIAPTSEPVEEVPSTEPAAENKEPMPGRVAEPSPLTKSDPFVFRRSDPEQERRMDIHE